MKRPIVLAYSGGAASTSAIGWLGDRYRTEVVTLTLDLGQGRELEEVRDRALATGAPRAHVLDLREPFAQDFILPALMAGACRANAPMITELAQPLVARTLLEVASIEGATTVAHACCHGADRTRVETALRTLMPSIRIVAPPAWTTGDERGSRADANLWGRIVTASFPSETAHPAPSSESRIPGPESRIPGPGSCSPSLESRTPNPGPRVPSPESRTPDPEPRAPDPESHADIEIAFERGIPKSINGVSMTLTELVESLSVIAARYGLGCEEVVVATSQGCERRTIEAPAAVVLCAAHGAIETARLPADLLHLKRELASRYSDVVENGMWFGGMRGALEAFSRKAQEHVTGVVRMTLRGNSVQTTSGAEVFGLVVQS